jgi:hypothetical protein
LYLLADDDPEVVVLGCKILARLLVAHGTAYVNKFVAKSGGFVIMANKLRRFWDIPTLWPICLGILFGYDVAGIDFDMDFDVPSLIDLFSKQKVLYSDAMVIVTSMLQQGLKDVMRHQDDPDSPAKSMVPSITRSTEAEGQPRPRSNSMELGCVLANRCWSSFSTLHECYVILKHL